MLKSMMNGANLPQLNKPQILIDWINTIKQPRCLLISTIHQLEDGKVFLEIMKHVLIKQGMPASELNIDGRLTPYERMKLVLCSLMELVEEEDKEKIIELDDIDASWYNNESFLLQFGYVMKDLYESCLMMETPKKGYQVLTSKWRETENNGLRIEEEESYVSTRRSNVKNMSIPAINIPHKEDMKMGIDEDDDEEYSNGKQQDEDEDEDEEGNYYNDEDNNDDDARLKRIFSLKTIHHPDIMSNALSPAHSSNSIFTYNTITNNPVKYNRRQKGHINMHLGLIKYYKVPSNSLHNNHISQPLSQHMRFLKPSKPLIDITINKITKYTPIATYKTHPLTITPSNRNMIITEDKRQGCLSLNKINHKTIFEWLSQINLIKDSNTIISKAKKGVLFCDIINHCERKEKIRGIIRNASIKNHAFLNLNKALVYLRKINLHSNCLWNSADIENGNESIIYDLLNDLHLHYSTINAKVKSARRSIMSTKPPQMNSDITTTLLLNDSFLSENILSSYNHYHPHKERQQQQKPMHLSSLSNIIKSAKINDISTHSHSSINTSTIAHNISAFKTIDSKQLLKNKFSVPSPKHPINKRKSNQSTKVPSCFLIFKKSNLTQLKGQIPLHNGENRKDI